MAIAVAVALLPTSSWAQQTGTVTGVVTEAGTQRPLSGVQVVVAGTNRGARTDQAGRFTIAAVPAGTQRVQATLVGFGESSQTVTVRAGAAATANFTLSASAVALEGLVVTASGEQQRAREVGTNVGRINVAEDVPLSAVNDISQVLQGRTAGVSVLQSSGTSGTGARIRIRGNNSVSLSNDPLWIVDGVRIEAGSAGFGVGGQNASRQQDINPEDIETMEVIKGPAAAALYGTAAANGVIVITTKKGRAGTTRFNAYSEYGNVEDVADYPANVRGFCSFNAPTPSNPSNRGNTAFCDIGTQTDPSLIARDIRLDSIVGFNPLEDPRTTPFEVGGRRKLGMSVSGGSEQATYFISGDLEDEDGVYKFGLSGAERRSLRANLTGKLTDQLDLTVSTGYINSDIRLPQNDNNALGIVSGALLSTAIRYDSVTAGYGFGLTPFQISRYETSNRADRFTGSLQSTFRPLSWLSFTGQAGLDRVGSFDTDYAPPGEVPFSATFLEGFRTVQRTNTTNYTANLGGTAVFDVSPSLTSTTSSGVQYNEDISRFNQSFGARLLAGVPSLSGANARFSVNEGTGIVRTIGGYVSQQIGLHDRLFLTGALRTDRNSAFGANYGWVIYPSVQGSWVVLEEPWFPEQNLVSTLRLRAAYGTAGLRPGSLDAFQFLTPVAVATTATVSTPGFTVGGAGNPNLQPEKVTETELGFDVGVLNDRVGVEFTYFNKRSEDALIAVPLAPSLGVAATRRENLGSVLNKGAEMALNARLLERGGFRWDANLSATWLRNELVDLGERVSPIIFGLGGASQRHTPGRPLGAYFARPYTFNDADGDGRIARSEITFTSDTAVYVGTPFPTREFSFNTNLNLNSWLRVSTLFDHRSGHKQFNSTTEFRCGSFGICRDLFDPEAPLDRQAAAVASLYNRSLFGYMEDATFTKWRELAVTIGLPQNLAQRFNANGVSLTLSGRNLATWTDYTGLDPEINFAGTGSNFSTAEFLTQPPARYFTARLDVSF